LGINCFLEDTGAFGVNISHNVFISWSGRRSRWIAEAMRSWLPKVIQAARPWMSEREVQKGTRGLHEIARALEGIKVGVTCLTPENLGAPWILYEAGALSKALDDETRLCTYLLGGLHFQDVEPPLGMFQATRADKEDTRKLVRSINLAVGSAPVPEADLDEIFDAMWPKLEEKLQAMPPAEEDVDAKRSPEDMIAEILELSRADANRRKSTDGLNAFIPLFEELLPVLPQIREALRTAKKQMLAGAVAAASSGMGTAAENLTVTSAQDPPAPASGAGES
jgi:hypothetical protein